MLRAGRTFAAAACFCTLAPLSALAWMDELTDVVVTPAAVLTPAGGTIGALTIDAGDYQLQGGGIVEGVGP
jgi:hypothetical protein